MLKILIVGFAVLASRLSSAEDLFIGVFESETRENFGTDKFGEYRIEIVASKGGRYTATTYTDGKRLATLDLVSCPAEEFGYFRSRPPGRAEALCLVEGERVKSGYIGYAEHGIVIQRIKDKYIQNPKLVAQEGLKPGDPVLFEARHHKAQYYAYAQAGVYGFRKVSR